MASKAKIAKIASMVGGLNVYANATQVKDNESPDLLNVVFKGLTSVRKRLGFIKLIATEVAAGYKIQGIFSYKTNTVNEILYVCNGVLYKYDGAGGSTAITGGTFHATNGTNACQIGSRLYVVDGSSALQYYDGTNIVTTGITGAPTKVKQVIKYNRRIYCNSDDYKDRVYYGEALGSDGAATDTGDFTVDADGGYFFFGLGKEVVGFAKSSSYLYVLCKDSIHRLEPVVTSGTLDHNEVLISGTVGCRAARSIENMENDIVFVDSTLYSLGEVANYSVIRTTNISGKVSALFDGMNAAAIVDVASIYYDKEETLLIAVQTGSTCNDHILTYQVPYKAWSYWSGIKANSFLDFIDSDAVKHLYFVSDDSTASYIYELYQGTNDDGVAISAYYKTKEFDLKEFNVEKIFQDWSMQFGGVYGSVAVSLYVNGTLADTVSFSSGADIGASDGWGTTPLGLMPLGIEGNYTEASSSSASISNDWRWHLIDSNPIGTTVQFVVENNVLNESFEVKQISMSYLPLPYRKREAIREV